MTSKYENNVTMIRETLYSIVKQLDFAPKARLNNDIKTSASKIYNLLLERDRAIERLYFIYQTCELCIESTQTRVDKMMKVIFPTPPTAHSMTLVSDFINFAMCNPNLYSKVLNNMSVHLNVSDLICIDMESWDQAESLALESPSFCSALMSRSDLQKLGIDKKLLAKWLQDISRIEQDFPPPSLNYLIKYSLFHQVPEDLDEEGRHKSSLANSDFHFGILTLIQSKRCQNLTNQYLMDVVATLAQQTEQAETQSQYRPLVDRFAQILSVAIASKITTITNALRNSLTKLDSNQLIASVIQWPNK